MSYNERLEVFAKGRAFVRLSHPVRDRADTTCDACGSALPRTLFGLKDLDTGRHYFVGDTCLKELLRRGAIKKRYAKESAIAAYDGEMDLRAQAVDGPTPGRSVEPPMTGEQPARIGRLSQSSREAPILESWTVVPGVLIQQTVTHFRAYVVVFSTDGLHSWGYAEEPKFRLALKIEGGGSLAFQMVLEHRLDDLALCLARALQQAMAQVDPGLTPEPQDDRGPVPISTTLPLSD